MTVAEFIASPFAVAALALSGALGSQLITARANLKSKRLELAYARKADAYRALLVAIASYVHKRQKPGNIEEHYYTFLEAMEQAALVGSNEVYKAIYEGELKAIVTLRSLGENPSVEDYTAVVSHLSRKGVKELKMAMRADLNRLGGL